MNIGQRSLGLGRAAPHQVPRGKGEFEGVKTPLKLEVDLMVKMGVMKKLLSWTECKIFRKTPKWLGLVLVG